MNKNILLTTCFVSLLFSCAKKNQTILEEAKNVAAKAEIESKSGSSVSGTLELLQVSGQDHLTANLTLSGLTPGEHGFHIHEVGDCSSDDGKSAGGHFNPEGTEHGAMEASVRHKGDFGNIVADENGDVSVTVMLGGVSLKPEDSFGIVGRAVVVHADADDLTSQPSGNAGSRVGCGIIEINPSF